MNAGGHVSVAPTGVHDCAAVVGAGHQLQHSVAPMLTP